MATQAAFDKPTEPSSVILEAWSEGMMGGALLIMILITISNMRWTSLLHKLILVELIIAFPDTFPMFFSPPIFGWYLSSASTLMIISWTVHNIVAWMKNKPFLDWRSSWCYIGTVALVQPYWILEIVANFLYFNRRQQLFVHTRPFEALCRDPWWIFTTVNLFWNIKHRYGFGFIELMRVSPRFAIMLGSMAMSICFIILDVLAVTSGLGLGGLNPFWKLSLIFKCLTDTIILDDFKTALDRLTRYKHEQLQQTQHFHMGQNSGRHGDDPVGRSRSHFINSETDRQGNRIIHVENSFMVQNDQPPYKASSIESTADILTETRAKEWKA